MWHENILGTIGNTPLVRLTNVAAGIPCTVLAKVEFFNPGGSVKDRIATTMIEGAIERGDLRPGGTIVEGTSGNTGAGIALAAIAMGYKCVFTTTDKQSKEKIDVLRALGAEVRVCPTNVAPDDPRSYYSVARALADEIPNSVYLNQYDNLDNERAHYETTGPEVWNDTDGRVTHFFCGAGTGGTISGTTRYLKEKNNRIKSIGIDTFGSVYYKYFHTGEFDEKEIYPYLTEGVGEDILAGNMNFKVIDDYVRVDDKTSMIMTRRLAREEGLFVGQSCGLAVAGTLDWLRDHASELNPDDVAVVVLPDNGYRYLNKTYSDDWMRGHGFLDYTEAVTADRVLRSRSERRKVYVVAPDDTLGEAIDYMTDFGISQLPVVEGSTVVGSLNESAILSHLIEHPGARFEHVGRVMKEPFPIVSPRVEMQELSAMLNAGNGAVLVASGEDGHFEIITKSDLIETLASAGRESSNGQNKGTQ
ncbi:MAG: pyridoxal-phosphate dependent enzyme [Rhodothermales bacterium]|nr:pyridoxal-phosphate dependent enzyme [Rhodothermales bacterium]